MSGSEFIWRSGDTDYSVRLEEAANGKGLLHLGDTAVAFTIHDRQPAEGWIEVDGRNHRYFVHRHRNELSVWIGGRTYRFERVEADRSGAHAAAGSANGEVRALMPGKVLRIEVAEGAEVAEKQTVIVMESMKMESALHAPRSGKVTAIRCEVGKVVDMGDVLMVIE